MGLLLTRSAAADLELPEALYNASVSEQEAHASGALRVLGCPRCHRRLCVIGREIGGSATEWYVPGSRIERGFFGTSTFVRCRTCGHGRVNVEAFSGSGEDTIPSDMTLGFGMASNSGGQSALRLVALRSPPKNAFRPFSACVIGAYESVVARAAQVLRAEAIMRDRALQVTQGTLRRSQLAKISDEDLPPGPFELVVIAHRISGQRNPLTDSYGLYTSLLSHAWQRAEVVVLCLFEVPCNYLSQLLDEQPTLLGLLSVGRLLPLFSLPECAPPDGSCEVDAGRGAGSGGSDATSGGRTQIDEGAKDTIDVDGGVKAYEVAEAAWWFVRCLDGRVPRVDTFPMLVHTGHSLKARGTLTVEVAAGAAVGSTLSVLASVVEAFEGQALVRD